MKCEICDKTVMNAKKYDYYHGHQVCNKCEEKHGVKDLAREALLPLLLKEEVVKKSFASTVFIAVGVLLLLYNLAFYVDYVRYYGNVTNMFTEVIFAPMCLIGIGIIIKKIEDIKYKLSKKS
jgi:hypothetical protein